MRFLLLIAFILPLSACLDDKSEAVPLRDVTQLIIESPKGEHEFEVEVVTTPQEMARGLMHRTELPKKAGMLFYFGGEEVERGFWMKNTLIYLDILFVKADGAIHHIHERAVPHDLTTIHSQGEVAAVLEVNGGLIKKLEIEKGDKVVHPFFE